MGIFNYEIPEKILDLITNFDKTTIIAGTTLPVKKYFIAGYFIQIGTTRIKYSI